LPANQPHTHEHPASPWRHALHEIIFEADTPSGKAFNIVVIVGALMYLIEGAEHGFHSIPHSVYWAIVTLTTVGYGDVAPETPIGQALAALLMITGYAIIAVPTGIVTAELALGVRQQNVSTQCCPACSAEGHDTDAVHCKHCGTAL
jgi:voltage-gated potassium channel